MFLPVDHAQNESDLPKNCTFAPNDWRILSGFWHPVAFAHDVNDAPVPARLLDVDLVIWRTEDGVSVARDLCPHRGTRLSAGRVDDG